MPSFLCLSQQRMLLSHQINLMFVQGSGGSLRHHSRAHKSLFVSQHRVVPLPRGKPQGIVTSAVLGAAGLSQVTPIFPGFFWCCGRAFLSFLCFSKLHLSPGLQRQGLQLKHFAACQERPSNDGIMMSVSYIQRVQTLSKI